MSLARRMAELATRDNPYPFKWQVGRYGYDCLVDMPGNPIVIEMEETDEGENGKEAIYALTFYRQNQTQKSFDYKFDKTGEGDAFRIISTVIAAVQQFIQQHHPSCIGFSAIEPSRRRMYERVFSSIHVSGYKLRSVDVGSERMFYVYMPKHEADVESFIQALLRHPEEAMAANRCR